MSLDDPIHWYVVIVIHRVINLGEKRILKFTYKWQKLMREKHVYHMGVCVQTFTQIEPLINPVGWNEWKWFIKIN